MILDCDASTENLQSSSQKMHKRHSLLQRFLIMDSTSLQYFKNVSFVLWFLVSLENCLGCRWQCPQSWGILKNLRGQSIVEFRNGRISTEVREIRNSLEWRRSASLLQLDPCSLHAFRVYQVQASQIAGVSSKVFIQYQAAASRKLNLTWVKTQLCLTSNLVA